uniref:non-specific serine/threonine protein kinase n=1 Tax=Meloidogyne incognita TaxID=6306 RepID=A0A914N1Y9_MELIC
MISIIKASQSWFPHHLQLVNYFSSFFLSSNRPTSTTMHTASISSEASVQSFQGATQEFLVVADIASGGYGAVYKVRGSKGGVFALKLEKRAPKRDHYKLQMEVRVLQAADKAKPEERQHLPTLIDHSEPHSSSSSMFIVMTLLGKSLGDIKRAYRKRIFSPNTAYYCAIQSIDAIKEMHDLGFLHRDIKPANFVIGAPGSKNANTVYVVDYGIARKFLDAKGSMLTPRRKIKFKGTVRFAPVTMHKMEELGRKDDCESWIYMVVDMVNENRLPWHMVTDVDEVERMKRKAIAEPRTLFKSSKESEFCEVITYLNGLHYVDKIDYHWIREMVRRVAKRRNCNLREPYDWQKKNTHSRTVSR